MTIDFTSFEKFNVEVVQRRIILTVFRLLQNGIFYVVIKTFVCSSFYDTHFEFCNIYLVVLLPTYIKGPNMIGTKIVNNGQNLTR